MAAFKKTDLATPSALWYATGLRILGLALFLYGFLVSIGLLGKAFKMFSGGFVGDLVQSASNPLVGLFVGILATTLVQSSSTTTSLVVALVGSGTMPIDTAIPVVMGANIGTSVTNTLVSLGHISHGQEFRRAFAASTVHDFFNLLAVAVLDWTNTVTARPKTKARPAVLKRSWSKKLSIRPKTKDFRMTTR